MSSRSTQFANPGSMAVYEPIHHVGMWESTFNREIIPNTTVVCMNAQVDAKLDNKVKTHKSQNIRLVGFRVIFRLVGIP